MTFLEHAKRSVSNSRVLVEIDISSLNVQWVNAGSGIWKVNFDNLYPEVDATLLDGFTTQVFLNIGSVQVETTNLTKVATLLLVTSTAESFFYESFTKTLWVHLPNNDEPFIHDITLGVINGYSFNEFTPVGSLGYYQGRLLSVPNIGYTRDPLYFGKISYDSTTLKFINNDGAFDTFADTFNIYGNAVRIYYGFNELNYADYQLLYTGYIETITINENEMSITVTDARKKLNEKIYYTCTNKNALEAIEEILIQTFPTISYSSLFFNITEWAAAKALVDNITIIPKQNSTKEVNKIIEKICSSVFGIFIIQPDNLYSFKLIDTSATAGTTITKYDFLNDNLEIVYDPTEVMASIKVGYANNENTNNNSNKTWLIDTSEESATYLKYKVKNQHEIETYLIDSTDAQTFATKLIAYAKDVHGIIEVDVPMKYYALDFAGTVNAEINRINTTMLGTKKCEILSKVYNLESNSINLTLRIV